MLQENARIAPHKKTNNPFEMQYFSEYLGLVTKMVLSFDLTVALRKQINQPPEPKFQFSGIGKVMKVNFLKGIPGHRVKLLTSCARKGDS